MALVTLDERGRLTLPERVRERYGDRYHIVDIQNGIKLVPVAADPLEALRDEFAAVDGSAVELRANARDTALVETGPDCPRNE